MEYVKEVRIFVEGIWNMAEATTDNGVIKGNWNELKFRDEVLNACNGWTHIIDSRPKENFSNSTKAIKQLEDIEKLCRVESFIMESERAITLNDGKISKILHSVMDDYTYGWYIEQENMFEQLKSINQFKVHILT